MKGKKLCGLLSVLFIIFGLSLSVCLGDVSALKHDIDAIPLYSDTILTGGNDVSNRLFTMGWSVDDNQLGSLDISSSSWFGSSYDSSSQKCLYNGSRGDGFVFESRSFSAGFSSTQVVESSSSSSGIPVCNRTFPFGTSTPFLPVAPSFDNDSFYGLTPVTTNFYKSLLPYYYEYSHFYVTDSAVDSNGVHYSSSLKFSDITGVIPNKFNDLIIPLGFAKVDVVGELSFGRSFESNGVFSFPNGDGETFSWSSSYLNSGYFRLYYEGLQNDSDLTYRSGYVDCSLRTQSIPANLFIQVSYSCPFTLDYDYKYLTFWLHLGFESEPSVDNYIFDTTSDWRFASAWFITDNDSSQGSNWNDVVTGNFSNNAPGSASSMLSGDEDFFSSLANLFNFNFFNPFSGIFGLFTDNSECVNIPILAGMLNSNETIYCPWFDSVTRNILTPVLGMASVMLVFGFAVRWLGSSSGNLFEDSSNEEVSNQGGRWGHFKRGGK